MNGAMEKLMMEVGQMDTKMEMGYGKANKEIHIQVIG
jgi:hypothetical protein